MPESNQHSRHSGPAFEIREAIRVAYLGDTSQLNQALIELDNLEEQQETLQRDYDLAVGWLDQYEHWASSMPDAGLTDADPRWSWYMRRPKYPDFPAHVPFPASEPKEDA